MSPSQSEIIRPLRDFTRKWEIRNTSSVSYSRQPVIWLLECRFPFRQTGGIDRGYPTPPEEPTHSFQAPPQNPQAQEPQHQEVQDRVIQPRSDTHGETEIHGASNMHAPLPAVDSVHH